MNAIQFPLEKIQLEKMMPTKGTMCLLDQAVYWDDHSIHTKSSSHLNRDNPLLVHNLSGLTQNDEMRGKNSRGCAVYNEVHEHSERVFNKAGRILRKSSLYSLTGIECAAQSMAVHSALVDFKENNQQRDPQGFLASIHNVMWQQEFFSKEYTSLDIFCERLMQDNNGLMYGFNIKTQDQIILSGRALVVRKTEDRARYSYHA